jgi:hypothetical protein
VSEGTYLANLIGVAEVVNIVPAGIVLLAADQWMHGTRLSTESRNRRNVSSAVFDLASMVTENSRPVDMDAYRLYFKSESVSIFPCAGRMILLDTIATSNDGATPFATESATLYYSENDSL